MRFVLFLWGTDLCFALRFADNMGQDYLRWRDEILARGDYSNLLRMIEDMGIEDLVESIIGDSMQFAEAMGEPYDYVYDVVLLLEGRFPVFIGWRFAH